jgi:AcrR family transcriptional regulator
MDVTGTKDAKQRVMHATVELLREGGLRAAAPAAVADRAGAGKMSLYRHFGSKDELVAEALRGHAAASKQLMLGPAADHDDPRQRVLAIFDRLARRADEGVLRPCVYVTTRLEVTGVDHPAASVTEDYKREVAETLAAWLREMHHPEPESTARTISMLIDGCIIHATITGDSGPILDARHAVETLLGKTTS